MKEIYMNFIIKESAIYEGKFRILDKSETSVAWEKPTYYNTIDLAKQRISERLGTDFASVSK